MVQEQITFLSEKIAILNWSIIQNEKYDKKDKKSVPSASTKRLKEALQEFSSTLKLIEDTESNKCNVDVQIAFICNEVSDLRNRIEDAPNNRLYDTIIDSMKREYDHLVSILEYLKQAYMS